MRMRQVVVQYSGEDAVTPYVSNCAAHQVSQGQRNTALSDNSGGDMGPGDMSTSEVINGSQVEVGEVDSVDDIEVLYEDQLPEVEYMSDHLQEENSEQHALGSRE